jgi:phospholipid/cholesterol/gamma-HCH transport system substrate-binding protein
MSPRRSIPQRVSDSFRVIRELDLSHQYERQAGMVVLLVLAVALVAVALAGGWLSSGRRPVRVMVEFTSANGLAGGDPVLLAGVPVGRVRRVELMETGRVRVVMYVQRRHRPRRDADFRVAPVNLLGDVAVSYRPGLDSAVVPDGTILAGRAPRDFAARTLALRETAEEIAVSARAFFRPELSADLAAARAATARAQAAVRSAPDAPVEALTQALAAGQASLAALDSLVARVPLDSVRADLSELGETAGALLTDVGETRARLADIQARLDSGQGNVGRALADDGLRRELEATRRSLDDLLFKYTGRRPKPRGTGGPARGDSGQ